MQEMFEMQADDPAFTRNAPLTVGSVSRALADSKAALASTHVLDDRLDDVDELLDDLPKSSAAIAEAIKAIDAGTKRTADEMAKLRASIDTPGMLAKLEFFEKAFHGHQFERERSNMSREDFEADREASREAYAKRDAFDDGVDETSPARFRAMYRIVR